jgi:hypothetical protein
LCYLLLLFCLLFNSRRLNFWFSLLSSFRCCFLCCFLCCFRFCFRCCFRRVWFGYWEKMFKLHFIWLICRKIIHNWFNLLR